MTIEGSSLPPATLAAAWAPFAGRTIDAEGLQSIVGSVVATYDRSPLALYTALVPDQTTDGGVLKLLAIEGYVQRGIVRRTKGKMRGRPRHRLARQDAGRGGYANSLLAGGDQLRLVYARPIRAPYYQSFSAAYALPLNADGLSLQVNAGKLKTRPRRLPLKGDATSPGGQTSYAAIRNSRESLTLSAGLDSVDSDYAFPGFTFSNERTRAPRLSASFGLSETLRQISASISAVPA